MDSQRPPVDAFCPACGAQVQQYTRHCQRCGVLIQWKVPSPEEFAAQGGSPEEYRQFQPPFVAPAQWVITTGWVLYAMAFVFSPIPFVNVISLLCVIALAVILGSDVYRLDCGRLRYSKLPGNYFTRQTNFQWVLGFIVPLVLWLYIPAYLVQRNQMARQVRDTLAAGMFMSPEERQVIDRRDLVLNLIGGILIAGLIGLVVWGIIAANNS